MAVEETYESKEVVRPTTDGTVRERVVATDSSTRSFAQGERVVNLIVGVLEALLAIRLVFSLLGANRGNGFADFIYSVTYPFVAPFFGLFGYTMRYGVARFELETVVAMVVYALVGYGIAKLLAIGRVR